MNVIPEVLASLNRDVLNQLELSKSIAHPGESGRAREAILRNFIAGLLPASFGVSTGFVFDAHGAISRQVDLIIHQSDYHPSFSVGGVNHFLVEAVVAVLEVKAQIKSIAKLSDALQNIYSVKVLDRCNSGKNYVVMGGRRGPDLDPNNFQHQIFGAIVTEQSMAKKTVRHRILDFIRTTDRRFWPNLYVDVRQFVGTYLNSDEPPSVTVVPVEAARFGTTDSADVKNPAPLIDLAFELVNFIRVAPVVDFKPTDYILKAGGTIDWVTI